MREFVVIYTDGKKRTVSFKTVHEFQNWLRNEGDHVVSYAIKELTK